MSTGRWSSTVTVRWATSPSPRAGTTDEREAMLRAHVVPDLWAFRQRVRAARTPDAVRAALAALAPTRPAHGLAWNLATIVAETTGVWDRALVELLLDAGAARVLAANPTLPPALVTHIAAWALARLDAEAAPEQGIRRWYGGTITLQVLAEAGHLHAESAAGQAIRTRLAQLGPADDALRPFLHRAAAHLRGLTEDARVALLATVRPGEPGAVLDYLTAQPVGLATVRAVLARHAVGEALVAAAAHPAVFDVPDLRDQLLAAARGPTPRVYLGLAVSAPPSAFRELVQKAMARDPALGLAMLGTQPELAREVCTRADCLPALTSDLPWVREAALFWSQALAAAPAAPRRLADLTTFTATDLDPRRWLA